MRRDEMHIQEGTNTTLTTCTKMTEEVDRRHGVNGNSSSKAASEDAIQLNSGQTSSGGRLKFFKDGKFILELVRGCAREGERAGWVSVPRKTFWPPAAHPPTPPAPPLAPSACLSVSDDNSSIQSSPWQRDHCWKQTTPRKNVSKELTIYYCRPSTLRAEAIRSGSRAKRRRPYDTSHSDLIVNGFKRPFTNGVCDKKRNGDVESTDNNTSKRDDVVDSARANDCLKAKSSADDERWTDLDREKYYHMKLKKPYQYHKLRVYKKTGFFKRKDLNKTIDKLRDKIASLPVPAVAKLANCRQEHMMVSPRKRILRELERVSLEDQGTKRRAKTVPTLSTASYPPSPGPSHSAHKPPAEAPPSRSHNGNATRTTPVSKNVSSYSIHSLLSMPDENPTRRSPETKRSPHSYPPSIKTESPSSVHSPDLSPSPDSYRYRYGALTLGSPTAPGAGHESPTPPPELARYRPAYAPPAPAPPAPASPFGRQWGAQYRGSPAAAAAAGGGSGREEWREVSYMYGYGYAAHPLYRAPPPLWMHYAMSPGIPPGPWAPLAHPLLTDHIPKDEPTSDLPLNLSKH